MLGGRSEDRSPVNLCQLGTVAGLIEAGLICSRAGSVGVLRTGPIFGLGSAPVRKVVNIASACKYLCFSHSDDLPAFAFSPASDGMEET